MGGNQNSFVKMHETPLNQNRKHVYLQGNDATMQWTSNGCISGALFSSLFPRGLGRGQWSPEPPLFLIVSAQAKRLSL